MMTFMVASLVFVVVFLVAREVLEGTSMGQSSTPLALCAAGLAALGLYQDGALPFAQLLVLPYTALGIGLVLLLIILFLERKGPWRNRF